MNFIFCCLLSSTLLGTCWADTDNPFDLKGYRKIQNIWYWTYEGYRERSESMINQKDGYLYEDQALKLLMKVYLEYRIQMVTGRSNEKAIEKAFKDVDTFAESLRWLD
jgi:hypothetical protein